MTPAGWEPENFRMFKFAMLLIGVTCALLLVVFTVAGQVDVLLTCTCFCVFSFCAGYWLGLKDRKL